MNRNGITAIIATLCTLLCAWAASANTVDFDGQTLGTVYGAPSGHAPGSWVFTENDADVYVDEFMIGGAPFYNLARIDAPFSGFGTGYIMNVNNIGVIIDFNAPGDASFAFQDFGGSVNIQVNGFGAVIEAPDFPSLGTFTVAPGVTMSTTVTAGSGITGVVHLAGPVQRVRIGGQELWIDDATCDNGLVPGGGCDRLVDHESLAISDAWGAPWGTSPGDHIFTEDGIPVFIGELDAGTVMTYNQCSVVPAVFGVGAGNVMNLNNVVNTYDVSSSGVASTGVTFEYVDMGGTENLEVNGAGLYVGDLHLAPAAIAPGVTFSVVTWAASGGVAGEVTLTGHVDKLTVGGQEFWIDDICVYGNAVGGPVSWCDHLADTESPPLGTAWGSAFGDAPGNAIYVEDGIVVGVDLYTDATGANHFQQCRVDPAFGPVGSGQVMSITNIGVSYDMSGLGPVDQVRLVYFDGAGHENLRVNGAALYVGELNLLPASVAPGVTAVVYESSGPGYEYGTLVLHGNVQNLVIGGQQFFVDDVCVRLAGSTSSATPAAPTGVTLNPNSPNPFNPSTTLSFRLESESRVRLTVHDLAGRVVRILVDGTAAAGDHRVQWDGRDEHGGPAAAGVYFVKVATDRGSAVQKIALIK